MEYTSESDEVKVWIENCQKIVDNYHNQDIAYKTDHKLTIEDGKSFMRVYAGGRIYAFVAMKDSVTATLGTVKAGDILKPATWKAPAKHARGNIVDQYQGLSMMGPFGPDYLK
jgi:hypothetical protein